SPLPLLSLVLLPAALHAAPLRYTFDVRPILSANCIACHGPDEGHRKAGLRLDLFEEAVKPRKNGTPVVPGAPEKSDLVRRITTGDPDEVMPPPDHAHKLSPDQIATLTEWIRQGARYERHWAFVPPAATPPPASPPDAWAKSDTDRFLAAKMAENGLAPAPPAAPHEQIRRAALALTGLPPSPEQVDSFTADPSDANYARIVDELLASPAYGERWASMWLDIARYADTLGYGNDNPRKIWRWRDWVIEAFNRNLPYDRFTVEQLAGDLLPDPTPDQILATAFHRNTISNSEGGTDDEEYRVVAVKDRANTTINAWMGLTQRCAECHTHKFDPISHKEYYQLFAFFNQTADADRDDDAPRMDFPPAGAAPPSAEKIEEVKRTLAGLEKPWTLLTPTNTASTGGATLKVLPDGSVLSTGKNPDTDEITLTGTLPAGAYTTLRLEVIPDPANGGNAGRHPNGSFAMTKVRVSIAGPDGKPQPVAVAAAEADHTQANSGHAAALVLAEPPGDTGWAVGHEKTGYKARRTLLLTFAAPLQPAAPAAVSVVVGQNSKWAQTNPGRVRLSFAGAGEAVAAAKKSWAAQASLFDLEAGPSTAGISTPIMQELPAGKQRETRLLVRGSFLSPGEVVTPGVLSALHPFPAGAPTNRLGLARWIVAPDNPLTARVAVNRFWSQVFGRGIVETEEDFGLQGALPTHPELLDALAVDFQKNGWDVKRLLRGLVTTAAFRQSSATTPEKQEKDPRNRLLSHAPRTRLRAEMVRDQALAAAGLLSTKMFGPPVYPPNPVKVVQPAFQAAVNWRASEGEDRYRRALYTYLQRSSPHPMFDTFDMASRSVCSLRRLPSNTPLQSFFTLNDEQFVEAAQALARRMIAGGGSDPAARLRVGFKRVVLRDPQPDELATLADLYNDRLAHFQKAGGDALQAATLPLGPLPKDLAAPEAAAMTVVANVLLNLDEFLNLP
ncbi:MAG: PSD1 and planctomycete cytochrome C domain-containing protein, partial [Kiritimatiellia bacterium]